MRLPTDRSTKTEVCFCLNLNKCTSYLSLFLTFRHQEPELNRSWNQAPQVLVGLESQSDTPERTKRSTAHSPHHVGLSPNLSCESCESTTFRNGKMMTCTILCKQWHRERSWRTGGKSSGKIVQRNPIHNLLEKLLTAWPVPTVFVGLILGTKEMKGRRTLTTHLGSSYY